MNGFEAIGPEYIEIAFRRARAADPDAKLLYNDFGLTQPNEKPQGIVPLLTELRGKVVPIDGIGFQMHVWIDEGREGPPLLRDAHAQDLFLDRTRNWIAQLDSLGFAVQMTEMDVRLRQPFTQEKFEMQGRVHREALPICLEAPNCTSFSTWGFSDRYSWLPFFWGSEFGAGLPLDEFYQPKPAYFGSLEALGAR